MTIKIKAKLVRTSDFEAVILTDEPLPLSEIHRIRKHDGSLFLLTEDQSFEVEGTLTGLESVFVWSTDQQGKCSMEVPKALEWAA